MKQWSAFLLMTLLATPAYAEEPSAESEAAKNAQKEAKTEDILNALDAVFPLAPEDIGTLRKRQDKVEEAVTRSPVAKISSESRPLPLEPGQIPPPVVLTPGYVGAIAFFDATGAPWPVSRAIIGNDSLFNLVTSDKGTSGERDATIAGDAHVLYVTPLKEYANSNLLVHLESSPSPVVIPLVSDPSSGKNRKHQGLVNFMVRARGPNAKPPVFTGVTPTISDAMMSFLDGVPPVGATHLAATPAVDGLQFWEKDNKVYMRGVHSLVWPAYTAYSQGNGVYVYEMGKVPSVMVSANGVSTSVTLEKEEPR